MDDDSYEYDEEEEDKKEGNEDDVSPRIETERNNKTDKSIGEMKSVQSDNNEVIEEE